MRRISVALYFLLLLYFNPSIFLLLYRHISVLINGIDILSVAKLRVFLHCTVCVQPATVILLSLLCACYHVDDVHSTYVNFIIIIIVLNSNLLNNICHICHLVFCQPHRASRERMHRPQN